MDVFITVGLLFTYLHQACSIAELVFMLKRGNGINISRPTKSKVYVHVIDYQNQISLHK